MNSLKVVVSEKAIADLKHYAGYIARDNPDAAERLIQAAEGVFEELSRNPFLGRVRGFENPKLRNLRSWRITGFDNYLIFYRAENQVLDIFRIVHGAMDLERELL